MAVKFFLPIRTRAQDANGSAGNFPKHGLSRQGQNGCKALLIHGLTGTPNEMGFLVHAFHQKGYSILCPRLANHGESLTVLQQTRWQECYQSVRDAFLKLEAEPGDGPIFASGLSMGALLALLLADEFGDRVSGVSCLSPTLFYDGWNMPWSRHLLPIADYTPLKHLFYFKEEPPYGIKNEAIRQRIHRYYRGASIHDLEGVAQYGYPYFPVSLLCELRRLVRYLKKRLSHIRVPVQLIQARDDDMTSVKNAQFLYRGIGSSDKELVLLDNSYHIITADYERETVAQKMHEFFTRLRAGREMPVSV